ncbi:MAG: von Willebrand factor type A domain-containing protein [Saprospirales bacterium]|nr:von Willebrand factor type A domain-containing protein [Saprospirales bacterium]
MQVNALGLEYLWQRLDYRFNPRKGWSIGARASAGTKSVGRNPVIAALQDPEDPGFDFGTLYDTIDQKTYLVRLTGDVGYFFPVFSSFTLYLRNRSGWVYSPQSIYRNEQIRIGGNRLLRGFDEESIFATLYSVFSLEYRLLLDQGPLLLAALVMASCAKEDLSSDNAATLDKIYLGGPGINNFSGDFTGDNFNDFVENPFVKVIEQPVSTFSVDADGASYSYIRRQLLDMDAFPPKAAVRTEELINYFPLNYAPPVGNHPVSVNGEVAECPWAEGHKLVRIGLQGKTLSDLPPSNIVLLIDVSGSMSNEDKLPLLKDAFEILVDQFDKQDRIAIVTYAGEAGLLEFHFGG